MRHKFAWASWAFVGAIAVSVGLSFIHPWGDVRNVAPGETTLNGGFVPDNVREVLVRKCVDCHSNRTHWPVYGRLAPASWLIERDVRDGRAAMNLSDWEAILPEDKVVLLTRMAAVVRSGEMPPSAYLTLHPGNGLTDVERQMISAWARAERKRIRNAADQPKGAETK
jgi:cytochrome c